MLTFAQLGRGEYGEYKGDGAEKCMIHRIMDRCLAKTGSCPRTPENYAIAYDFIESDEGWFIWDNYYELFQQKHPNFVGPLDHRRWCRFNMHVTQFYHQWKNRVKKEKKHEVVLLESGRSDVLDLGDGVRSPVADQC